MLLSIKDDILENILWSRANDATRINISFKQHVNFMSRTFANRVELNYLGVYPESRPALETQIPGVESIKISYPPGGLRVTIVPSPGYSIKLTPMLAGTVVVVAKMKESSP